MRRETERKERTQHFADIIKTVIELFVRLVKGMEVQWKQVRESGREHGYGEIYRLDSWHAVRGSGTDLITEPDPSLTR